MLLLILRPMVVLLLDGVLPAEPSVAPPVIYSASGNSS
jgi:hypothetical protein